MTYANALDVKGRERRRSRIAAWMWVPLCMLAVPAFQLLHAQANAGLTGRVTDPSGAAIPNAHVTFTNEATGITSQYAASSVGVYVAPLPDGTYDITVEATGFQRFEQTHVVVEVGTQTTDNIQMKLGSSSQTVEVSSLDTIGLDTTDPQLDSMLPTQEVTDLPLQINGYIRQVTSFATLAPGVRSGSYGSITDEGGAPSQINSAGNYYNGLQLDTASDINSDPPFEMVDEFRVVRNPFSAKYGMVQGAADYAMREGTNQLHGDGFLIDRNSFFDSDGFFPADFNKAGKPVPPEDVQTDWGGTVGGPVVLPRLYNGHNKTFFLGSVDLFNWKQGQTAFGSVPTQAMVGGDFTNFVNSNGVQIPIYDPQTGQQFNGCNGNQPNVICPNRFDPLSKSLLQYIPAPNAAGTNYGLQNNEAPAVNSIDIQNRAWGVTLNHQISPSQNVAFTWWRNHYYTPQLEETSSVAIVPASNPLSGMENLTDNANVWLVNYSKTVTPNLVMTAGFAAQDKWQNNQNANTNVNFAGILGGTTMPHISFNGQEAPTGWGNFNSDIVLYHVNNVGWNLFNNWMWNKGRHTFNIGGEFHHYYANDLSNYSGGQFSFSQAETSIPNTTNSNFAQYGSSFASFLLGLPDSAARSASTTTAINTVAFSAYIQDDIKLTTKLTLNAGLRYDLMLPYAMAANNNVFLNTTAANPAAGNLPGAATEYGNCPGCAGYNRIDIHGLYFGPRVGFAYSLDKNTVIQGGYTITALGYGGAYGQGEGAYSGPVNMAGLLGGSYTLNSTGGYTSSYGQWSNSSGAAVPIPNVSPTPFSPGLGVAQTIYYLDRAHNGEAPILQMWSLSVQRQIPWHTMLTIDYTGNRVTHLSGYTINPIEQPNPSVLQYGAVLTDNINSAAAKTAGFTAPYANFATQFGGGATVYQALKPFPQYSNVSRAWDQSATTYFSAFQIQAEKHLSNNVNFLANIELPRLYDNMVTTVNKYDQAPNWGLDSTGSFESKAAVLYNLPFGQGQRWLNSGATGKYAGGWQVAAILTYNNSQPLAITQTGENLMNGTNRPNINSGVPMWSGNYNQITKFFEKKVATAPLLFSTNAFSNTGSQYVLGNANRVYNSIRGPWYPVENLSAKKLFHVTEASYFTLRMDYFNALNRVQAPFPTTSLGSSNFGQVTTKFTATNREGQAQLSFNF
jgi:Carboxypeptidase regulatory-like domain